MINKYKLRFEEIVAINEGANLVLEDGRVIQNNELIAAKWVARKYAYCSDTCYDESIVEYITGVDLLYHEATFMQAMQKRAKETFHSTTIEAATIAQKAGVKKLMIGHYSARYKELEPLLIEAQSVFANTILAIEGQKTPVEFQQN